jgi:hypothetical protein
MNTEMWKEFIFCGVGMVVDVSGSHYLHSPPPIPTPNEAIASNWKETGNLLRYAVVTERPRIELEAKQLHLKLGD